jgi:UDP:flavonoid glycosyltransferase YjiC (YdhE family)
MSGAAMRPYNLGMRLLFTATHGTGHVVPVLPFAHACRAAGHDVVLAGPPAVAPIAAREGIAYRPLPWPEEGRLAAARAKVASLSGPAQVQAAAADLYVGAYAHAALPGTLALAEELQPDAILFETAELSALVAADALGVPALRIGVTLATPYESWWLSMAADALDAVRAEAGLAPDPGARRAQALPLLTQVPRSLEAGRGEAPALTLRFRDTRAAAAARAPIPEPPGDAPLVPISFGTMLPTDGHFPGIYRYAIASVAQLPVRALVTVGRHADPAELGPLPRNVRVERWVPIAPTLSRAAAFVTHGGAGTTLAALAAGVPMALLPIAADQPLNARIVEDAGAGRSLGGGPADAPWLGGVVAELLEDGRYRAAAGAVAGEIAALPPIDDVAVACIEESASRAAPWAGRDAAAA